MPEAVSMPKPGPRQPTPLTYVYRHGQSQALAALSRCCQDANGPYRWHAYYPKKSPELDRLRAWYAKLPPVPKDAIFGILEDLFESAASGLASPYDDGEPIKIMRGAADSYELRALLDPDVPKTEKEEFRHYHYEPAAPWHDVLVALHGHLKNFDGTPKEVSARQDAEMEFAYERCDLGRQKMWDLPTDTEDLVNELLDLPDEE